MAENSKGSPDLPGEFEPGEVLTAEKLERLREAVAFSLRDLIRGGRGVTVTKNGGRFIVSVRKARRGGGAAAEEHPWMVYPSRFTGSGDPPADQQRRFRLRPGTVGNRLAANWDEEFTAPDDTTGHWVWAEVSIIDSGDVSGVTIQTGAQPPTAALTNADGTLPTTLYAPLASMDTADGRIRRIYTVERNNLAVDINSNGGSCDDLVRSVQLNPVL